MVVTINSKTVGYAGITTFSFTPVINPPSTKIKKIFWQFDDGSTSNVYSPNHIFNRPGVYNVTVVIYSTDGEMITVSKDVTVKLFFSESIYFDFVPPPTFTGHVNKYPFKLIITSASPGDHYIDLGVQFSRSYQSVLTENKWGFLKPNWNFYDLDGKKIKRLKTKDDIVRVDGEGNFDPNGSFVAGVTGYAEFYFTEDIYNSDLAIKGDVYTTIIATLDTLDTIDYNVRSGASSVPSMSNSLAQVSCPYVSLYRKPDYLKITENGIRKHSNPRWATSKIPLVINSSYYEYKEDFPEANSIQLINDFAFNHNFPLSNQSIQISAGVINISAYKYPGVSAFNAFEELTSVYYPPDLLVGLQSLSSVFLPTPTFEYIDSDGYKIPGYYKGFLDVEDLNSFQYSITAKAIIPVPSLTSNYYNPHLWISNPGFGQVTVAQYFYQQNLSAAFGLNLNTTQLHSFDMPVVNTGLSGYHGIYSIAATPSPSYQAWLADSEMDYLYRVSTYGQILCAIDLKSILINNNIPLLTENKISPAYIALDSKENIWISLFDTHQTIKLNKYGKFLLYVDPSEALSLPTAPSSINLPISAQGNLAYDQESYFPSNSLFDDINLYQPTSIDTDILDNVYVTYTNPYSGFLTKYSSTGNISYTISKNLLNGTPLEVVCDNNENYWLSVHNSDFTTSDYIYLKDSNGSTLQSYGPYLNIHNMTIDKNHNLWFTFDYSSVGKINPYNEEVSTVELPISNQFSSVEEFEDNILEGICADQKGRIYVINSLENKVLILNSSDLSIENSFFINPQGFVFSLNSDNSVNISYNKNNKSAQAVGDWSGYRWIHKYVTTNKVNIFNATSLSLEISGRSNPLDFYVDNTYAYNLYKINENYSVTDQIKDLAFIPSLAESKFLFEDFIGGIFGQSDDNPNEWGIKLLENISNFVSNVVDVDTCTIDQLYDLSAMLDSYSNDLRLFYPQNIKRLMDLASVNPARLRGFKEIGGLNFANNLISNRGNKLPNTYVTQNGEPLILKDSTLSESYRLIYTGRINRTRRYTLDTLAAFLKLKQPWTSFYEFYEYKPSENSSSTNGLIDWSNPGTTINYETSAFQNWFKEEGILETMLVYELYKGLKLLK